MHFCATPNSFMASRITMSIARSTAQKKSGTVRDVGLVGYVVIVLIAFSPATLLALEKPETKTIDQGEALAQEMYDRPRGDDASSRVVMLLQREGNDPRQRILYNYGKDKGHSERWTLLRFVEPQDIDGTGLLTLDFEGDSSDQWLYLPALDRVRRIASSRKGGRFVGSDFFYEDLRDREVAMDQHRLLGNSEVGGVQTLMLESTPVDPNNSVYTKRVSWVHPEMLLPLRVEFYQRGSDQPVKRLQASKIQKVQGYWTVFESTMQDLRSDHRTTLVIEAIQYDQGLPDEIFTQKGLADDSYEAPYRP
jgi:Outer membrane lipoprotein-sorting protein